MKQEIKVTQHPIKWKSESENVDIETGEIISKKRAEIEYIKLRTTKEIRVDGINGKIKYKNEYERKRQIRLF